MTENYLLEVKNVSKSFGVVKALNRIDFNVRPNEIHALCGENGAGKSTLMNILSGVYPYGSYGGEVYYDGELCKFRNVRESEKKNIAIIHQHLALFPALSIAENIFLGNENAKNSVIDWTLTIRRAAELMERVGLHENPETKIRDLGVGKQQLVEICKAISKNVRLLILDEPTAALNDEESALLLELMRKFRQEGISCIFITHKLHEITAVADRITIIRDGETIETLSMHGDQVNEDRIIKGMVGREMKNRFPARENHVAEKCFEVRNWTVYQPTDETRKRIDNVSFYAKKGEVLGIAGLMGAGRTELAMSIFGRSYGTKISGTLIKDGKEITCPTVAQAIANSIGYVSEDRHRYGCIGGQSIKDNITLTSLAPDKEIAREWLAKIKVFLQERLHLETNQKTKIFYVRQGVNAYGFKIKATHLLLRTESKRREKRRIKRMMEKLQEGTITKAAIVQSVNSWLGFARWACAYNLAKKIFAPYRFIKTEGELPYGAISRNRQARRILQQRRGAGKTYKAVA